MSDVRALIVEAHTFAEAENDAYNAYVDSVTPGIGVIDHTRLDNASLFDELAVALEAALPQVVATADELWEVYPEALASAFGMPIADAFGRLWIIGDDEDGYQWATSFLAEGDEFESLPVAFDNAPIQYPVTILKVPQQSPVPQTGEPKL